MTRSGAYTKPVPSIRLRHSVASPVIFRTLGLALSTTGLAASAGSGGATSVTSGRRRSWKTSGKSRSSTRSRSEVDNRRPASGTTWSTAPSTTERCTCELRVSYGELATARPTSQATSSRPTTLTAAPAKASTCRAGRQVRRLRTAAPTTVART